MPIALLAGACVGIFTTTDVGASAGSPLYSSVTRSSSPSSPTPTPIGSFLIDAIGRSSAPASHFAVTSSMVAGIIPPKLRLQPGDQCDHGGDDESEHDGLHQEHDRPEDP